MICEFVNIEFDLGQKRQYQQICSTWPYPIPLIIYSFFQNDVCCSAKCWMMKILNVSSFVMIEQFDCFKKIIIGLLLSSCGRLLALRRINASRTSFLQRLWAICLLRDTRKVRWMTMAPITEDRFCAFHYNPLCASIDSNASWAVETQICPAIVLRIGI